jgi:hypothetical protein
MGFLPRFLLTIATWTVPTAAIDANIHKFDSVFPESLT